MATLTAVDFVAVNGEDKNNPAEEDTDEEQFDETPERKHVDALLDISEEEFMKEMEPFEYHCYTGWEEAVRGWARVDPLSCILLAPKAHRKAKHKEAATPTPLPANPTIPNTEISDNTAKHRCDSHEGKHSKFHKPISSNQHTGYWSNTAVGALQKDASVWPVITATQETMSSLLLKEKVEQERMLRETHHASSKYSVMENRPSKHQKHSHRPNSTVVPIKNFTFLPPINPSQLYTQRNSGRQAEDGGTTEENCFMLDSKSRTRGLRVDPVANPELPAYTAALTSTYRTCQHNPLFFSAVSVSIPKRYQVPVSSKPDTLHRGNYSTGKSLTQALHSGTAAGVQAHIRPNKTVCAAKLYEGCEINV